MIIESLQKPMPGHPRKMDKTRPPKPKSNLDNTSLDHVPTLCKQIHFSEALGILGITGKCLDFSMYVCLLQGCIQRNAPPEGKVIHAHIKQSGFTGDALLHNTLLNVYAKCGTMVDARKVFNQMP
jgi:pentatricopeptide repeat protein